MGSTPVIYRNTESSSSYGINKKNNSWPVYGFKGIKKDGAATTSASSGNYSKGEMRRRRKQEGNTVNMYESQEQGYTNNYSAIKSMRMRNTTRNNSQQN